MPIYKQLSIIKYAINKIEDEVKREISNKHYIRFIDSLLLDDYVAIHLYFRMIFETLCKEYIPGLNEDSTFGTIISQIKENSQIDVGEFKEKIHNHFHTKLDGKIDIWTLTGFLSKILHIFLEDLPKEFIYSNKEDTKKWMITSRDSDALLSNTINFLDFLSEENFILKWIPNNNPEYQKIDLIKELIIHYIKSEKRNIILFPFNIISGSIEINCDIKLISMLLICFYSKDNKPFRSKIIKILEDNPYNINGLENPDVFLSKLFSHDNWNFKLLKDSKESYNDFSITLIEGRKNKKDQNISFWIDDYTNYASGMNGLEFIGTLLLYKASELYADSEIINRIAKIIEQNDFTNFESEYISWLIDKKGKAINSVKTIASTSNKKDIRVKIDAFINNFEKINKFKRENYITDYFFNKEIIQSSLTSKTELFRLYTKLINGEYELIDLLKIKRNSDDLLENHYDISWDWRKKKKFYSKALKYKKGTKTKIGDGILTLESFYLQDEYFGTNEISKTLKSESDRIRRTPGIYYNDKIKITLHGIIEKQSENLDNINKNKLVENETPFLISNKTFLLFELSRYEYYYNENLSNYYVEFCDSMKDIERQLIEKFNYTVNDKRKFKKLTSLLSSESHVKVKEYFKNYEKWIMEVMDIE